MEPVTRKYTGGVSSVAAALKTTVFTNWALAARASLILSTSHCGMFNSVGDTLGSSLGCLE